jgi:hypothetical protein
VVSAAPAALGGTSLASAALVVGLARAAQERLATLRAAPLDVAAVPDLVGAAVLAAGLVAAGWYAASGLVALACLTARVAGRRWSRGERALRRFGAPWVRRLVAAGAGAALGGSLALATAAAAAAPELPDDLRWAPPAGATAAEHAAPPAAAPTQGSAPPHVVAPGESLWTIAAGALADAGRPATPAAVAAQWPRWYAANADVIGPEPDLIHPGQVLVPPAVGAQE